MDRTGPGIHGKISRTRACWLVCIGLAAAVQLPLALNHDNAWLFYMSFRLLAGDQIGTDIIEANPPTVPWMFLLPAKFVELSGASPAIVFKACILLICTVSYFWVLRLLATSDRRDALRPEALFLGAALFIMPGYDFGQREHLAGALTLPYVALVIRRTEGAPTSFFHAVLVGLAAAAGIGMKHYFLALPLCVELWLFLRGRHFLSFLRPETSAIGIVGVTYLIAVALFAPGYYLYVIPDLLMNYGGYEETWPFVVGEALDYLMFALGAVMLAYLAWGNGPVAPRVQVTMTAAIGFLMAALLQKKGFAYHFYPVALYLILAAGLIYADRRTERGLLHPRGIGAGVLVAIGLLIRPAGFVFDGYSEHGTTSRVEALRKVFDEAAGPEDSVFAFITSPRDIHPAVLESGSRWAASTGAMLHLPAEIDLATTGEASDPRYDEIRSVSERSSRELIEQLEKDRPAVIAVDDHPKKLGIGDPSFDYLEYFRKFPRFQTFWSAYEEGSRIGKFRIFLLKSGRNLAATVP